MLFQPSLRSFVIRAGALHFPPKPRRMIHFPQVHDLVNQNIISDEGWRLDEPPIQGDRPASGTGTPPRPLVAHRNPAHGQLMQCCVFKHSWRQFLRRLTPEMSFNSRTQIRAVFGYFDGLAAELDHAAIAVHASVNFH